MLSRKSPVYTELMDSEKTAPIASTENESVEDNQDDKAYRNLTYGDQPTSVLTDNKFATSPNKGHSSNIRSFFEVNPIDEEYSYFDSVFSDDVFTTRSVNPDMNDAVEEIENDSQVDSVINDDIFTPRSSNVYNLSPPRSVEVNKIVEANRIEEASDMHKLHVQCTAELRVQNSCETLISQMASSSKTSEKKLIEKSTVSKFVTDLNPNPYRQPTTDEIFYSVPHLPRFSVHQQPTMENLELSLMKKEIEMRLRVNDLSWATQRAIREESLRVKKVTRSNQDLKKQLQRYGEKLTLNQLILDYDKEKKTFIRVHPALVTRMKPHQKEGVKFMYDCCYGSVSEGKTSNGSGCILAHCMGLGKTLQVIALINTVVSYSQLKTKRIIVVCPKSTVMNWNQEFRDWLEDVDCNVRLLVSYFPDSSNILAKMEVLKRFYHVSGKNASCLLIGYEAYRSLIFYDTKNRHGEQKSDSIRAEIRRYLINPGADLIILDEGHIIKNRKSMTNLAIAEVATKRRIILTGTPIQNNLNEYFCMVSFVKPAYLGSEREFNEHYAKPIKEGQHKDSNPAEIKLMKMKSYILHKHLTEFVHRKEFSVLKEFLPKKYDYVIYVPLTPVQEDLYEDYLRRYPFKQHIGGLNLLEDYTFLRKIWTHPIVLEQAWENAMKKKYGVLEKKRIARGFDSSSEDEDVNDEDNTRSITNAWWKQFINTEDLESIFPSNKMLLLFEILKMCQERGEKCLIFSGFVMVLNMVEYFMKKIDEQDANPKADLHGLTRFRGPWRPGIDYYRIDGGTAKSTRHEMVTKFNDPHNRVTRVFLISTKAGGQGINLVGANRVIILDTSWNPAVDQQGIFRIYRLGQTKTCYIYRLLAIHTMEEKVYSRAVTKEATSRRVADKKQVDRNYNMAELEELYHFERVDMGARENLSPAEDDLLSVLLWKHHKLIYRYHTHEMMLDNKTEKDLTELEKKLAWTEFKKKGVMEQRFLGEPLSQVDSQLDTDTDSPFTFSSYDHSQNFDIFNNYVQKISPTTEQSTADTDSELMANQSSIFGEDPYEELSTGSMSIIEEQRMKFDLKSHSRPSKASHLNIAKEEIDLLRELEENSLSSKNAFSTTDDKIPISNDSRQFSPLDSRLSPNPSCDKKEEPYSKPEQLPISVQKVSSLETRAPLLDFASQDSELCSLIEYDPIGDTEEFNSLITNDASPLSNDVSFMAPTSYENFKANILKDNKVVTSTVNPPVVVVEVVSSSPFPGREPIMTRAMKRKMTAAADLKATGNRRNKTNRYN